MQEQVEGIIILFIVTFRSRRCSRWKGEGFASSSSPVVVIAAERLLKLSTTQLAEDHFKKWCLGSAKCGHLKKGYLQQTNKQTTMILATTTAIIIPRPGPQPLFDDRSHGSRPTHARPPNTHSDHPTSTLRRSKEPCNGNENHHHLP